MKDVKIKTNFKYVSKNPISRVLVDNFNNTIRKILNTIEFESILDAGCGEGITFKMIENQIAGKKCTGFDLDPVHIEMSKKNAGNYEYKLGDIYNPPFEENSFDTILCLEVLEHLDDPGKAIINLSHIGSRYFIFSVPREPLWHILNLARGAYIKQLGNTPGHINHWSSISFTKFIKSQFKIIKVYKPIPWTIVLAEKA